MTSDAIEKSNKHDQQVLPFVNKIKKKKSIIIWSLLSCIVITAIGIVPPRATSIRCDDPSIQKISNHVTVSVPLLLLVSFFGPLIIMIIVNWLSMVSSGEGETAFGCLKRSMRECRGYFTDLVLTLTFGYFIVEMLKTAVSEPRPNFMQLCAPILTEEMCSQPYVRISYENCTNPHNLKFRRLIDSMKSFPSGHALFGTISSIFTIVFIHKRLKVSWSKYLGLWLQLVCLMWGLACSFSRIIDNKHHWWDVLAGAILGFICVVYSMKYLCLWFNPNSSRMIMPKPSGETEKTFRGNTRYVPTIEISDIESGTEPINKCDTNADVK